MPEDTQVCERGGNTRGDDDPSCCGCGCPCAQGETERLSTAICCPCHEPS